MEENSEKDGQTDKKIKFDQFAQALLTFISK